MKSQEESSEKEQAEVMQLQQALSPSTWTDEQEEALQELCVAYLLQQVEEKKAR